MNQLDQLPPSAEEAPSPGAYLRSYREAHGMSIDDVAQALKLTPRQVMAIETDDYDSLSGPTFVRGFIRNYARLLRLDPSQLMTALDTRMGLAAAEFHVPENENVRMPQGAERPTRRWMGAALFAGVLLVVALVLYFNVVDFSRFMPDVRRSASVPEGQSPALPPQPQVVAPATGVLPPQPAPSAPEAQPAPPPAPADSGAAAAPVTLVAPAADTAAAAPPPGVHRLVFSFNGDSWVEVRDAKGKILLSQLNGKGSQQTVEARGPLSLVIGNASNVRLEDNGQPLDLKPYIKVDVARLKVQ